jgi:hypothetical protein
MMFLPAGNLLKNMPNMPVSMYETKAVKFLFTAPLLLFFFCLHSLGQGPVKLPQVDEIKWELDYGIYLRMTNDSAYQYDIRELFHVKDERMQASGEFVLYPVNLGEEYIYGIAALNQGESVPDVPFRTLWAALHDAVGGGWEHFNNCLLYALETRYIDLAAPLMKRTATTWKPDPATETWRRTRHWEYYAPVDHAQAKKEYKIRKRNNELGDIRSIPAPFIDLFLHTGNHEYRAMKKNDETKKTAQIDLVKLMLGINYLAEPQISYLRGSVLNAFRNYSANKLPSIIIFDAFNAAAVMSLDIEGYKIDAIAFLNSGSLTAPEADEKKLKMQAIIGDINIYNRNQFMKRLDGYYRP